MLAFVALTLRKQRRVRQPSFLLVPKNEGGPASLFSLAERLTACSGGSSIAAFGRAPLPSPPYSSPPSRSTVILVAFLSH
jgi:hypothetical protein